MPEIIKKKRIHSKIKSVLTPLETNVFTLDLHVIYGKTDVFTMVSSFTEKLMYLQCIYGKTDVF
jgi:hypothetical protein